MKTVSTLLLCVLLSLRTLGCGWYDPEEAYYNLFMQEIIGENRYFPFLVTYKGAYYASSAELPVLNENIEDWQGHLNISYDQAYYLVFKSERKDLINLLQGNQSADRQLAFVTRSFLAKHREAIEYLEYAKFLEPYMAHRVNQNNRWDDEQFEAIGELPQNDVIQTLKNRWQAVKNKALKVRYGYQLVRFAHYSGLYNDALDYFDNYVEALNFRPIMYYYALDQKAGAQRALGQYMEANAGFFQFFTHTKNRKENAYTSMRVTQDLDFERLLDRAGSERERNDIYLLLGFRDFNNPLASMKKIVQHSPDAIQAKVLMARAINQLERKFLQVRIYCPYYQAGACLLGSDHRLPLSLSPEADAFLTSALRAAQKQANNPEVDDPDFWRLSAAYLHFLHKDFNRAAKALAGIENTSKQYRQHINRLSMLIEVAAPSRITPELENQWVKQYPEVFDLDHISPTDNSTAAFLIDLLANRYYLQGDTMRAFLLQNNIDALESNPDLKLLREIEHLYLKKDRSAFEELLAANIAPRFYDYSSSGHVKIAQPDFDFVSYAANLRGSVALRQGRFNDALVHFGKIDPEFELKRYQGYFDAAQGVYLVRSRSYAKHEFNGYDGIPASIFGSNMIECFSCPETEVMDTTMLHHFSFIKPWMNKKELAFALLELNKIGNSGDTLAPLANKLIADFLFNTSTLGYFRHVLTFNLTNGNDAKYRAFSNPQTGRLYYKEYALDPYFPDDFSIPMAYAEKALAQSQSRGLSARILFTTAKIEQGMFFKEQRQPGFANMLNQLAGDSLSYSERREYAVRYKVNHFRSSFQKLKRYPDTRFYQQVKSNCLFFDYYLTHF